MSDLVYPAEPTFFCRVPLDGDYPVTPFKTASGRRQVIVRGPKETAWHLAYPLLTEAEAAILDAFHEQHLGPGDSFLFDAPKPGAPGGTVRKRVAFAQGGFQLVHEFQRSDSDRCWSCSVTLELVFDGGS